MSEETKQVAIVSVVVGLVILSIAFFIYSGTLSGNKLDEECLKQGKSLIMGNCIKVAE
jgi:hypothetical protein